MFCAIMSSFWENLRYKLRSCDCTLKSWGFLYGWLGVIWRTIATFFLATVTSRLTDYDPNIYLIGLITALSYIQISLVANMFYLVGIQKEKPYFMLAYIAIGGLEIFFGIIIFISGTILLNGMNISYLLWWFIPLMLAILVFYSFLCAKSTLLFKDMEVEISRKREENARIASIRESLQNGP